MKKDFLDNFDLHLAIQGLIDGSGYPKSEENQKQIGYSAADLHMLTNKLLQGDEKELSNLEKQMILNCIDGALHYVDIDIPTLYDISEEQLKKFLEDLEARWGMKSTY